MTSTTVPYYGGEALTLGCDGKRTITPSPTTSPSSNSFPSPSPILTSSSTSVVVTNVNNNQVIVQNGRFTVQNTNAAMSGAPDCPPQSATVVLGPSPMQNGGARILTAFEPCIPTDGTVILNPPDKQGIQHVAANIQGGQATRSVVAPMQRIAPISQVQTSYTMNLNGQITGPDPTTGNPITLIGNTNKLFLWNNGGQKIDLSAYNSVALISRR
jgi:hypothetical protein